MKHVIVMHYSDRLWLWLVKLNTFLSSSLGLGPTLIVNRRTDLTLIPGRVVASRTLDPRVVSLYPGRSMTCGCVPGQNTTTNCQCLLPGVYARGSERPQSCYINVTCRL